MKVRILVVLGLAGVLLLGTRFEFEQPTIPFMTHVGVAAVALDAAPAATIALRTELPTDKTARTLLNQTSRHPEWVTVPAGSTPIQAFVVYPERPDNAPVVLVTSNRQGLSDRMRAVGDQLAGEGFIAVVPDLLSGLGPNGGGTYAFPDSDAVARRLAALGSGELMRRTAAMQKYANSLPAGDGNQATLGFNSTADGRASIDAVVHSAKGETRAAGYELSEQSWPKVIGFLTESTGNHFEISPEISMLHSILHTDHAMPMPMAQAPAQGGGAAGPAAPRTDLPPPYNRAKLVVARSPRRHEFVDIPIGNAKLHTFIAYPQSTAKTGVVVVMQPGPGFDEWLEGVGDQLASHGFIAVVPDLLSGLGPNGGNTETFEYPDDLGRARGRLTQADVMARYQAALAYGLKLPQSNGKSGSIGFCVGGGDSWRFAAVSPGLNAAVSYYGGPPEQAVAAQIHAPVLAFFGEIDLGLAPRIAPATALMKELGKPFEVQVYSRATHAFLNRQDLAENMKATEDAWPRTVAFFRTHLN